MTHGSLNPILLVGGGRTGRAILAGVAGGVQVTLIDPAPPADLPPRTPPVRVVPADGTSRLVLQDAGAGPRTIVIAATGSDRVNHEVLRVATELGVTEVIGVFDDPAPGLPAAEVVSRPGACASQVLNRVAVGSNRGSALGLGIGEIVQVTVLQGSQAVGRSLREIGASHWLVAALYRDDALIVPHGTTTIAPGDRVLLVGDPEVLEETAAFFRGGDPVFPYQYGPDVLTVDEAGCRAYATWLASITDARATRVVGSDPLAPDPDAGCVIMPPERVPWAARAGLTSSRAHDAIARAEVPVLIARRPPPVRRVLLALDRLHTDVALVAFDVARQASAPLTVLTVSPPPLVRGADPALAREPRELERLARVHGVTLEHRVETGNPIVRIREAAADHDLVVIGVHRRRPSPFDPDVSVHLLHDLPASLLLVPRAEP